ncbi:MAG: VanZ family protein [Lachnospiraceae bacterium]|nr:VanZ family protein [Lachnospiraceae bacterium]
MVISKKTQMIILGILIALTLTFIWGNSALPGTKSSQLSDAVKEVIDWVLEAILPEDFFQGGEGDGTLVRKLAHFTEFTLLGTELTLLIWQVMGRSLTGPLLWGLLTAVTDETIQLFSPGRGSSVRDVWIDFGGVVTGMAIILLVRRCRGRHVKKSYFSG